ncbi:MAG: hypothetical protein AB7N76_08040 [Planctomycetota bacterium]
MSQASREPLFVAARPAPGRILTLGLAALVLIGVSGYALVLQVGALRSVRVFARSYPGGEYVVPLSLAVGPPLAILAAACALTCWCTRRYGVCEIHAGALVFGGDRRVDLDRVEGLRVTAHGVRVEHVAESAWSRLVMPELIPTAGPEDSERVLALLGRAARAPAPGTPPCLGPVLISGRGWRWPAAALCFAAPPGLVLAVVWSAPQEGFLLGIVLAVGAVLGSFPLGRWLDHYGGVRLSSALLDGAPWLGYSLPSLRAAAIQGGVLALETDLCRGWTWIEAEDAATLVARLAERRPDLRVGDALPEWASARARARERARALAVYAATAALCLTLALALRPS